MSPGHHSTLSGDALAHVTHWLFRLIALYLGLGVLGSLLSASRGEWQRARRGALTLLLVVAGYLGLLLAISLHQPTVVLAPSQSRCFGTVCFQVVGVEEPIGFRPRAPNVYSTPLPNNSGSPDPDRLIRLRILVTNTSPDHAGGEAGLRSTLIDEEGRSWQQVPGLAGVPLSARVQSRGATISSPVFRVAPDSSGLRLVLQHAGWYAGRLTLADPESLLHRPEQIALPPARPLLTESSPLP